MEAIITGDIIQSTQLAPSERQRLETYLWQLLAELSPTSTAFSISRGDSFQLHTEAVQALATAVSLRCHLKIAFPPQAGQPALDARVSIGIGQISLHGQTLSSSDGSAFRYSGRQLEKLKEQKYHLAVSSGRPLLDAAWEALAILMDDHISHWNHLQAEAVLGRLQQKTFAEIGEQLQINPSAVYKRIESAHWKSVKAGLDFYRRWIEEME